jgi:septum formation protein
MLAKMNIKPDKVMPADIDESEKKGELPKQIAARLSESKASKIVDSVEEGYIIGSDSIVALGRRTLPKALSKQDIIYCMNMLSGRRHKVYTGITIIKKTKDGKTIKRMKVAETIIKFKRLTDSEIEEYASSDEGLNKAGGYSIQGFAESFISYISGSYSNVVGLPLFEVRNMLISLGYYNKG